MPGPSRNWMELAEPKKVANHAAFAIVDQLNLTCRLALLVDDRDFLEMTEQSGRFQQRILCPPSALVGQIRQIEEGSVSGSS